MASAEGTLGIKVIRAAETWQFFAFVFAALFALEAVLLQNIPWLWLRVPCQTVGFVLTFYLILLNSRTRNLLVRLLTRFKELEQYEV